jgi:hypothetical protein
MSLVSSIPSKKSDFTAPSFAVISATASICVALAACGGGGDPTSTDTGAPTVAPEVKSDTPATDAAGNPIDHHVGDLTDNRLELALAPAPDLLTPQTPQDPAPTFDPGPQAIAGNPSAGQSGPVSKSLALPDPPLTVLAADWISAAPVQSAPTAPAHGGITRQSPPEFSWPAVSGAASYRLEVSGAMGIWPKVVRGNWAQWWTATFPAGVYQWRVQPLNSTGNSLGAASSWRTFTVAIDTTEFRIPSADVLMANIKARARPRSLPGNGNFDAQWASRIRTERTADLATWYTRVKGNVGSNFVSEPSVYPSSGGVSVYTSMPGKVNPSLDYMVEEALVARIKGDTALLQDSARRAILLAGWNPNGATSHKEQDQVNRYIASSLALMFDRCYDVLTDANRALIRSVVQTRLKGPFDELVGSRALENLPYDSHGYTILGHIAAATAVMAGEGAQFDAWAQEAIPLFAKLTNPWGGEEGGFANGSAYGSYVLAQMSASDALRDASGIDIWKKPWGRNFGVFLTHMFPPGAPAGAFGDESESFREDTTNFVALARRVDVPLVKWKADRLTGVDRSNYWLVAAPFIGSAVPAGFTLPKAEVFSDVGVVSIQTDLADPKRASLYFRSSPYGSVNHGHADQNSFILNVGSKRTFINSGVDDSYWSPEYSAWYVQTKAHNAITYDGGVGQVAGSLAAKGQVTAFKRNAAGYTLTSGDAQKAYPSGMNQATRTIVAAPDGSFITVDQLGASSGRRWEYNLHVPGAATTLGSGRAQVNTDRGALCIQPVAASQSPTWWGFSQAKIPDMAVSGYGSLMGTYQMKWTAPSAVTSAVLPMHFDFGCNSPAPVVTQANSQVTIQWDGFTWVVDSRGRLISAS